MKKIILIFVLILAVVAVLYYFGPYQKQQQELLRDIDETEGVGLANPAAVYCQTQGGTLKVFAFESGEDAYCVFEDGSVCWEWDFYEGYCDRAQLKINVLQEGFGRPAETGDEVLVHYTGTLLDGMKFDSSIDREEPFSFFLGFGSVIPGWEQGVLGMRVGEKRELVIGSELAYGESGFGEMIPLNATLIFEIELLEILSE